eukprot:5467866-Ditylum_brightwellii.AAC.1
MAKVIRDSPYALAGAAFTRLHATGPNINVACINPSLLMLTAPFHISKQDGQTCIAAIYAALKQQ